MSDPEDPGGAGDHPHRIVIADEQRTPVDPEALERLAAHALAVLGVPPDAELSIVLATPKRIAELKGRYMGEERETDVLAFPMDGATPDAAGRPPLLGDVVICPAVAERQAAGAGHPAGDELNLLLVHGILHLLGHDHAEPEEETRMKSEQERILRTFAGAAA